MVDLTQCDLLLKTLVEIPQKKKNEKKTDPDEQYLNNKSLPQLAYKFFVMTATKLNNFINLMDLQTVLDI